MFSGLTFSFFYYIQSDDKSIVYQNRAGMCLDRSQYTGSKSFTDSNIGWNGGTCDQFISTASDENGNKKFANFGFGSGKKLWADASSCSDFTEDQKFLLKINSFATECCGGKTVFDSCKTTTNLESGTVDYSRICKNPNNYVGSNTVNGNKCDAVFPNLENDNSGVKTFAGLNFATLSCKDISTKQAQVISYDNIDTSCCSDGKSLCYQDLSKLCKNPSDFDGTAKWDKKGSGNTNVCSVFLSTQLRQFAQLNLTLNDVDSNTCDDYIVEKGDGSGKQNILRWIHDHSECCGSGGAAKNGCPLTVDLKSTGSKDMFFGAILFVLPILITALQGSW